MGVDEEIGECEQTALRDSFQTSLPSVTTLLFFVVFGSPSRGSRLKDTYTSNQSKNDCKNERRYQRDNSQNVSTK